MTAGSRESIDTAIRALDEALGTALPAPLWFQEIGSGHALDVARASLQRWAEDLGDSLGRIADALETAPESVPGDDTEDAVRAVDALATGLVQVGAARDRIYAIAAQALGAPYLVQWRQGLRFSPDEKGVRSLLNTLAQASVSASASKLKAGLDSLEGHAAIDLRNEIVHAIRPFPALVETCWVRRGSLNDRGHPVAYSMSALYPSRSLDQDNALPETLWVASRATCKEAFEILLAAAEHLATLIQESELAAPQTVFVDANGGVLMERP